MIDSINYNYINSIPSGTMIYDTNGFEIILLIKETQSHLAMVPEDQMHIEFRSSFIILDDVALVPLLVQINHNPILTYQQWFNYYDSENNAKQYFYYLATQEILHILFCNGDIRSARGVAVNNNLQLGFKMHMQQLKNRVPWSAEDFENAKSKMLRKYPTTLSLWHGLKKELEKKVILNPGEIK